MSDRTLREAARILNDEMTPPDVLVVGLTELARLRLMAALRTATYREGLRSRELRVINLMRAHLHVTNPAGWAHAVFGGADQVPPTAPGLILGFRDWDFSDVTRARVRALIEAIGDDTMTSHPMWAPQGKDRARWAGVTRFRGAGAKTTRRLFDYADLVPPQGEMLDG